MRRCFLLLWFGILGMTTAWGQTHPRLLFNAEQRQPLRTAVRQSPLNAILQAQRDELTRYENEFLPTCRTQAPQRWQMYDFRPRMLAILYTATGDRQYAEQAKILSLTIVEHPWFADKRTKGLTRAAAGLTVALAYDQCYEAWDQPTRDKISKALLANARSMGYSMGRGANNRMANNWQAVRYAGMGIQALACDEPEGQQLAKWAYDALLRHLQLNLGDNGWNPEGIGYTVYPFMFTGPFGIAAHRAGIGDLRQDAGKPLRMTLWTTYAGTVNIPHRSGRLGVRADLADDHPHWNGHGMAGLAFYYLPEEYRPAGKWMYDYLCGERGSKQYDNLDGGSLYSLLYYPQKLKAVNPATGPPGLIYHDPSHGLVIFRNRFKDKNDFVVLANAHQRQPSGCHGGPDTNTFRILGLGNLWVTGSGRTANNGGQTNLFAKEPGYRGRGLGKLEHYQFNPSTGDGQVVMTGSCTGVQEHQRMMLVDYQHPQTPAVVIIRDSSANGRFWRLNSPGSNRIRIEQHRNQFRIQAPNQAQMIGTVIHPTAAKMTTGEFIRDQHAGRGVGFVFNGKSYPNNQFVQFQTDDGNALVILIFAEKQRHERAEKLAGQITFHAPDRIRVGPISYQLKAEGIARVNPTSESRSNQEPD